MKRLPDDWLKILKREYPRRSPGKGQGWPIVEKKVPEHIKKGESWDEILEGVRWYAAQAKKSQDGDPPIWGTGYVMQARTFFGPGKWWTEFAEESREAPTLPDVIQSKIVNMGGSRTKVDERAALERLLKLKNQPIIVGEPIEQMRERVK